MDTRYYDFEEGIESNSISTIFRGWNESNERIVVYSPHDDDALLGAGYLISEVTDLGAEAFVFIFCEGNCGYSKVEDKEDIVQIRKEESRRAYDKLGIEESNIFRFGYSDFSSINRVGWKVTGNEKGSLEKALQKLREIKATRILVPNGYREHLDHEAVSKMGSYHAPQAGDPIVPDWGEPTEIHSVLEYTVWADFSPLERIARNRKRGLRANCGVKVDSEVEGNIRESLEEYESQREIITGLMEKREERKLGDGYIEVYRRFDPRPSIDYGPYKEFIKNLKKS